MARQIDHQTKFVAYLMGGPASFTDEHLARVHEHLRIDDESFDELVLIFRETLEDHDMDETDVGVVIGELTRRRRLVVTEGTS
jgi:hemoglobin